MQQPPCSVAYSSSMGLTCVRCLAVSFSQQEAEVYLKVHAEAKAAFQRFLQYDINRHMLSIMSLLGPLRSCCSGGALHNRVCLLADSQHKVVAAWHCSYRRAGFMELLARADTWACRLLCYSVEQTK